ncbi:MAG: co-chaperone GroES [Acidaminococcaceae bacterium]
MLKPLADHIVVEAAVQEEKTSSGIFLPDTASKEKPQIGKVIAVGAGRLLESGTRVAPEVKAGDQIVFAKYSGTEIKLEGKDYLILSERDVLAVVTKK